MTLLEEYSNEAFDFVRESLENHAAKKWKFAVMHGAMAVEKILKAKLAEIDPALVFTRPGGTHTVSLVIGLEKLKEHGVEFDGDHERLVTKLNDWRNGVAHRTAEFDETEADECLGEIYKIFTDFAQDELDLDIKDYLPADRYHEFKELLKRWEAIAAEAKTAAATESFEKKVGSHVYDCPDCWESGTVVIRGKKAYCHLCNEEFDFEGCLRCGRAVIGESDPNDPSTFCEDCVEYIASQ